MIRHCVSHFHLIEISEVSIRTRGNMYKVAQHHCHYDLRNILLLFPCYTHMELFIRLCSFCMRKRLINTYKRRILVSSRCDVASETVVPVL